MKNCLLIALAFVLSLSYSWAQPPVGQPTEKLETMAGDNLGKNDTWNALDLYMKVYDRKPNDPKATFDVAYTYFMLRDYADAETWFKKVLDTDKDGVYKLARWYYAYSMKLNGRYADCIPVYEQFKKEYDGSDAERYKALAQIEIDGAKWAQTVGTKSNEELKIANAGKEINSALMENYAYPVGRDKMIFSSLRSDTIIFVEKAEPAEKFVRIFMSEFDADKKEWKKATDFNPTILQKDGFHAVNPTFNANMTKFYFVRAKLVGNMMENSKIYYCSYDGTTLGQPVLLDFNGDDFSCKNPAVGMIDGKEVLFFSSNMQGTKGGFDIWYAEINADGTTRQPLNLTAVNSVGDDVYPFFDSRDNNLYFASTGHPGLGGLDMFTSNRAKNGQWGKVTNMGPGFNTSLDEFAFIINREGKDDCYGYFISNREGTTQVPGKKTSTDDIFSILMPERCDVELTIKVLDQEKGNAPVNGAVVQLIEKSTGKVVDEQSNTTGNSYTFLLEQGKEYEVVAKKEGWESGAKTYVDARRPALEKRFGTIDNPMAWEDKTTLKELGLIVETYNKKTNEPLSGVTVLVYGANNEVLKESTVGDSRHEFKIARSSDVRIQARLQGFVGESKTIARADMKNVQRLYLTPPPIFVNVLFDYDKFNIRQGASDTLDMIANILKEHPDMVVEVRGHTDAHGPNAYNERLSQNRSKSAIDYLIAKGVEKDRMIPKGFGKLEPIAPNETPEGKDNPEGRQLNRRVEFKIIKGEGAVGDAGKSDNSVAEAEKKK
jgi:outer membrane protein OmpA-like peptidoglycan-associated protein/tetratricopeptide (TPR) repeat protein